MQDMQNVDWNVYAECYDSLLEITPYVEMLGHVASAIEKCGAQSVLDAGCGTGNLVVRLACSGTPEITGADSSAEMLARAKVKCMSARFTHADLNGTLPFENETFDTIACVNALYIVEKPVQTLVELRRILRKDGMLVVATPKHGYENGLILKAHCKSEKPDAYWLDAHASIEREEKLVREALKDERHVANMLTVAAINRRIAKTKQFHFFTEAELREVICSAGFQIAECNMTYARQSHLFVARKP